MMNNSYWGYKVTRSELLPNGTLYLMGDVIVAGKPHVSKEIYDIFHQGDMLKWYEYIDEGQGSIKDLLFGYPSG